VMRIIKIEEENFGKTLIKGTRKFYSVIDKLKEGEIISGADAFKLFDTYGFPLELTETMGMERKKLKVNQKEFDEKMKEQMDNSGQGDDGDDSHKITLDAEAVNHLRKKMCR